MTIYLLVRNLIFVLEKTILHQYHFRNILEFKLNILSFPICFPQSQFYVSLEFLVLKYVPTWKIDNIFCRGGLKNHHWLKYFDEKLNGLDNMEHHDIYFSLVSAKFALFGYQCLTVISLMHPIFVKSSFIEISSM